MSSLALLPPVDDGLRVPDSVKRAIARGKQRQEEIDRAQALMEQVRAREATETPQARWARWRKQTALYQEITDKDVAKGIPVTARLHERRPVRSNRGERKSGGGTTYGISHQRGKY
jgi:hypothetical protein